VTSGTFLAFSSAFVSGALALSVVAQRKRSLAHWAFSGGMLVFAAVNCLYGFELGSATASAIRSWHNAEWFALALLPGPWLLFSLTYARGNYIEFLRKWSSVLVIAFLVPLTLSIVFWNLTVAAPKQVEGSDHWLLRLTTPGFILNLLLVFTSLIVLMNLERTYRAAVGTMRWRIKFMVLGLGVIFVAQAYTTSQIMLFRAIDLSWPIVNSGALIVGGLLIVRSLFREGNFETDVFPSHSILHNSLTVLVAGVYLLIVGALARLVAYLGGNSSFTAKAVVILVALVLLALILQSDRVRLRTRHFISRHFQRPFYDYRTVWRKFTEATARRVERGELCVEIVKFNSEIFQALSVTVWLIEEGQGKLSLIASTSLTEERARELELDAAETAQIVSVLSTHPEPIDLDASVEKWAVALRRLQPDDFHKGGNRICVPLNAGGELLGVMMLGDRVSGEPFSLQDLDLLKSIGDQIAANLLNIKFSQRLSQAKQLEAFQAMSAFFVHDLKNTASTLSLMLQNLPIHFNDPQFREDALRGISKTVTHINDLIKRLSLLRQEISIQPVETDFNAAVTEALKCLDATPSVELIKEFKPLPKIRLDPAHFQNVVVNLALNAKDAINARGRIRVETAQQNGWAVLTIADSGCGMNPEFMQRSLFRPFQTTKKQGIGIGMFQCKMIVEAHHGKIEVQSELNKGTTFRILLPAPVKN
jgi:putative PEP-CTERM system histidine kinase